MTYLVLNLEEVTAHSVVLDLEDAGTRGSTELGPYKTLESAQRAGKGRSAWGSDGTLRSKKVWQTQGGTLYEIKELGRFLEDVDAEKNKMLSSIESKLTPEELAFIKLERL